MAVLSLLLDLPAFAIFCHLPGIVKFIEKKRKRFQENEKNVSFPWFVGNLRGANETILRKNANFGQFCFLPNVNPSTLWFVTFLCSKWTKKKSCF